MNKYSLLLILSVASLKAFAGDLQTAQNRVNGAAMQLQQTRDQAADLDNQIKSKHDQITQMSGKPEFLDESKRRTNELNGLIERRNALVRQCKDCIGNLGKELHSVSDRHVVTGENGRYNVAAPAKQNLTPIVHKPFEADVTATGRRAAVSTAAPRRSVVGTTLRTPRGSRITRFGTTSYRLPAGA